jgi:hypothetical protein
MGRAFVVRLQEAHNEGSYSPCVYSAVHDEHYFHHVYFFVMRLVRRMGNNLFAAHLILCARRRVGRMTTALFSVVCVVHIRTTVFVPLCSHYV